MEPIDRANGDPSAAAGVVAAAVSRHVDPLGAAVRRDEGALYRWNALRSCPHRPTGPRHATEPAGEVPLQRAVGRVGVGDCRTLVGDQVGHQQVGHRRSQPGHQVVAGVGACSRWCRW